jgi:hypothetical protein
MWEVNSKMVLERRDWIVWTGLEPVESSCEHYNEILGSTNCWEKFR